MLKREEGEAGGASFDETRGVGASKDEDAGREERAGGEGRRADDDDEEEWAESEPNVSVLGVGEEGAKRFSETSSVNE